MIHFLLAASLLFFSTTAIAEEQILGLPANSSGESAPESQEESIFEVRLSPVQLLWRGLALEGAMALNPNWDIGVNLAIYTATVDYGKGNMFFPTYNGHTYGINTNYYYSGIKALSGWYTSLKLAREDFESVGHASKSIFDNEGYSLTALGGYRANMQSLSQNLYVMMGLGLQFVSYSRDERVLSGSTVSVVSDDKSGVLPNIELKLAYQF